MKITSIGGPGVIKQRVVNLVGVVGLATVSSVVFAQECPVMLAGSQVGTVANAELKEISGIAVSRKNAGVIWAHNDSGDTARVFALDFAGDHLGVYNLAGAQATDYEDMAIGPGPDLDLDYLYIADTGDNQRVRSSITVYRVAEPVVSTSQAPVDVTLGSVDALPMVYPGSVYDCETLIVDPLTGDLYLITRDRNGVSGNTSFVFRNPAPHAAGVTVTLEPVTSFPAPVEIKGGDVSALGDQLLLRPAVAGQAIDALWWEWADGASLADVFAQPGCPVPAAAEPQGEAIAFAADGQGYFTVSEGVGQPIYWYAPQPPESVHLAGSEISVSGTVAGSFADTWDSDDGYQEIREETRGGNVRKRKSLLEHKWVFSVPPGDLVTLFIEAHHSPNSEGDDFDIAYSTDDSAYTSLLTISKTADDDQLQVADLPPSVSGTVFIRATDLDRRQGNGSMDRLFVDLMFIRVISGDPVEPGQATNPVPEDGATGVSLSPTLSWDAGSGATGHVVYFGDADPPTPLPMQTGMTFEPGLLAENTVYYWRVDEVNSIGTTDGETWSFATGVAAPTTDDVAVGETSIEGTQAGTLADTHISDDVYEIITEAQSGKSVKNRRSRMEHEWTIAVTGGAVVTFHVEAYHTANSEGDDLVFHYSTDGTNFTPMLTVTKTSDDNVLQSYRLADGTVGDVIIRLVDSDRTRGNSGVDSAFIDRMFIRSE